MSEKSSEVSQLKPRLSARLLNIVVPLLLSLIAGAITIELGLRHFYNLIPLQVCAADYIIANYVCQPYFVYDKPIRIGYRYKPGMHREGWWDPANPYLTSAGDSTEPRERNDAFWYVMETDEMGFPNSEYKWRDAYDMIIIGDSFITRTAPKTWIELLREESGFSILTLGAPSWGTLGEAEAIKMYGLDKHPDWVLLTYFEGNDLLNVSQYLEKQASGLSWKEYDLKQVPWSRRLLTPHLVRYLFDGIIPQDPSSDPPRYRYPVSARTEAGEIETVFNDIHLLPLSADYETLSRSREFAEIKRTLLELNALVQAQGARFLVVYIPSKEHVLWSRIWDPVDVNNILERTVTVTLSEGDSGFLQWEPKILSYDVFNQNHNAQERLFDDFASEAGIEFLNLTPIFWRQSIAQGELYHYADPHWNQAGNELAAEAIWEYIHSH
ncbi:MAG: hypothetical protein ACE5E7_02220 [Anaerolineae bacterium]